MSYQVSARKYRPQSFAEVVGQPHIVRTLSNAISANRVAHAYLFSGVRGVGKTTVARVFAKALNCENGPTPTPCNRCEPCRQVTQGTAADVLEIDGASNNGVDAVRDLTDNIRYRPLACRYKIYIIDEVHMLSTAAFNALLKTLEEPPDHAVFIFATTETHKIPRTILSRCQHHAFRRIGREEIGGHLAQVARQDGIEASRTAIGMLARAADGSMRDGLSLFDQAVSFGDGRITQDDLTLMLGVVGQDTLTALAAELLAGDAGAALARLRNLIGAGHDLQILAAELVEHFRNLLMCRVSDAPEDLIDLAADDVADLGAQAQGAPQEVIEQVLALLTDAQERCRRALNPRFVLEAALVRCCQAPRLMDLGELLARLEGSTADTPRPAAPAPRAPQRPAPAAAAPRPEPARPAPPQPAVAAPPPPAATPPKPQAAPRAGELPPWQGPPPSEGGGGWLTEPPGARTAPPAAPERGASAPAAQQAAPPAPAAPRWTPAPAAVDTAPAAAVPARPVQHFDSPKEMWLHVLHEVRKRRAALASYLEQGTLREATDTRVEIGFLPAYEVMRGMVSRPENVQFIHRLAQEVTGRDIQVVFSVVHEGRDQVTTLAQEHEARTAAAHRQEVEKTMEMPFVKDVLDAFGGEIISLRKPES